MEYKYYYNYEDDLYYSKQNEITETEYKKSIKFYSFFLIFNCVLIIICLIKIIINGFNDSNIFTLIGFIPLIITSYTKYKILKIGYKSLNEPFEKDYQEEITLQITKKGMIEKDQFNNKILNKWKNVKKINQDKNYLYIIMKKGSNMIIPLRIFNDENDENNFLNLLKKHV